MSSTHVLFRVICIIVQRGFLHDEQIVFTLNRALAGVERRRKNHRRRAAMQLVLQLGFLAVPAPRVHFACEVDILMRLLLSQEEWYWFRLHCCEEGTLRRWASLFQRTGLARPPLRDICELIMRFPTQFGTLPRTTSAALCDNAFSRLAHLAASDQRIMLSNTSRADRWQFVNDFASVSQLNLSGLAPLACGIWFLRRRGFVTLRIFYPLVRLARAQRTLIHARHELSMLYAPTRLLRPNTATRVRILKQYAVRIVTAFFRYMPLVMRESIGSAVARSLRDDGFEVRNLRHLWRMMIFQYDTDSAEVVPREMWILAITYAIRRVRETIQHQRTAISLATTCKAAYLALTMRQFSTCSNYPYVDWYPTRQPCCLSGLRNYPTHWEIDASHWEIAAAY